jgi:hypothetical protein
MIRASAYFLSSSDHTYQSARGLSRLWRDSWNQGCWSDVWLTTRSVMMRMPRRWASSMSRTASPSFPYSGRIVKKSEMS